MKTITLSLLLHRGQENIAVRYEPDTKFTIELRRYVKTKWSRTHQCWYCMYIEKNVAAIKKAASKNMYRYDDRGLQSQIREQHHGPQKIVSLVAPPPKPLVVPDDEDFISESNSSELERFRRQISLEGYSDSTLRTYTNEMSQFLRTLRRFAAQDMTPERLKDYLHYCATTLALSEATLHSRINTLKFYYEKVLGRERFFFEIPRPKKHFQLPKVLGEKEIGGMFNAIKNLKHKAILFTAYSAGLRVSEVVHLKIRDVDSERMQLFIEKAKGKKDRYVGLSILLLDVLRSYIEHASPRPQTYLFENPLFPDRPYSIRAAQKIFQQAKYMAGVKKDVGFHSMRHSFATHLLEKGIDIRYIKDLLGHFSIKTTERYLHVKRDMLVNIPNVLDELNKSVDLKW